MNEKEQASAFEQKSSFMSRFGRRSERDASESSTDASFPSGGAPGSTDFFAAVPAASRREEGAPPRDMNVFTEGLTIEGNVTSEAGIVIRGTVHGSVSCRADVEISGQITGDVEGKNVRIVGGGVQGNITAGEMLSVDRSRIKGNLSATHARINNPIEGDIAVRGTLTLQREADIRGNITAAGLSVEEGASMNGRITISRETPAASPSPRSSSRTRSIASERPVEPEDGSVELVTVSEGRLPLTEEVPVQDEA